jgi:hypothetical protein
VQIPPKALKWPGGYAVQVLMPTANLLLGGFIKQYSILKIL